MVVIDRDPDIFKIILSYLRNNQKMIQKIEESQKKLVGIELDWWGINTDDTKK